MTVKRMQQRRGTAAAWTSANPILSAGEFGYETDTKKLKVGDGSTAWSALIYVPAAVSTDSTGGLPTPSGKGLEFIITAAGLTDIQYNGTSL